MIRAAMFANVSNPVPDQHLFLDLGPQGGRARRGTWEWPFILPCHEAEFPAGIAVQHARAEETGEVIHQIPVEFSSFRESLRVTSVMDVLYARPAGDRFTFRFARPTLEIAAVGPNRSKAKIFGTNMSGWGILLPGTLGTFSLRNSLLQVTITQAGDVGGVRVSVASMSWGRPRNFSLPLPFGTHHQRGFWPDSNEMNPSVAGDVIVGFRSSRSRPTEPGHNVLSISLRAAEERLVDPATMTATDPAWDLFLQPLPPDLGADGMLLFLAAPERDPWEFDLND